ncbi:hypothetical protein CUMW_085090 [Citrus unshiu]|nr:hypothetical protein CUMW_085090 [Citrus unshiu]
MLISWAVLKIGTTRGKHYSQHDTSLKHEAFMPWNF